MQEINERGLVLIGCGFMGRALLEGWLAAGLERTSVTVQDPAPSDWLRDTAGVRLNQEPPDRPAVLVIATKPQSLPDVLPPLARFGGGDTAVISICAGAPLEVFEEHLGDGTPVIRAMPNLPASVGLGATALFPNARGAERLELAEALFAANGTTVRLEAEEQMHLVTGLSGSGPAYVFALAEAMAEAGVTLGLPDALALALAVQTVAGAGRMLAAPDADPTALRKAVTSKGGTTAAGLAVLQGDDALADLLRRTVAAAADRSRELARGE